MAIVCLFSNLNINLLDIQIDKTYLQGWARKSKHTCNRPFNSRSPRNLTKTISSMERRTRSRGSETAAAVSSGMSAMRDGLGVDSQFCGVGLLGDYLINWGVGIALMEVHFRGV